MKFALFFILNTATVFANNCDKYLPEKTASQQAYMNHFFNLYKERPYENSKFSMQLDKEYFFTRNTKHQNNDVISFGSGPDILRPLIDFPHAKRYHLVDIFTGWGKGPLDVFFEIKRRLHNSWPGAKVEVKDWGFLNKTLPRIRNALKNVNATSEQANYLKRIGNSFQYPDHFINNWEKENSVESWLPWKMTLTWESEEFGKVIKDIYVHPHDFNYIPQRKLLFRSIKNLSGILVTGITAPDNFQEIMNRMISGGAFVVETFDGFPINQLLVKSYEESADYDVKLVEAHAYLRWQEIEPTMQRTYVIFKK